MRIVDLFDKATYLCDKSIEITDITYHPECSTDDSLLFLLNNRAIEAYRDTDTPAKVIVVEKWVNMNSNHPKVIVDNIRQALSIAYKRLFCDDLSCIRFVGITGTNGKSTTAIFLKRILENSGEIVGLFGTGKIQIGEKTINDKNYSMTTPSPDILYPSIAKMKKLGVTTIIMEVSSHALDQERVYPIEFDLGIFTNLSREHLDYHGDINSYFKSKQKLFKKSKHAVINTDDTYGRILSSMVDDADTVGSVHTAKYMATDIKSFGIEGVAFKYITDKYSCTVRLKVPASYNVYNALLAMRAAEILGIDIDDAKIALESVETIDGRFNIIHSEPTVIIDYAHTSSAFYNLLKNLYSIKNSGQKLYIVFGCGGERDKGKRSIMGEYAELFADEIIVTSDNPRGEDQIAIINDITKNMKKSPTIISDRQSAIIHAILNAHTNDIVAIVGKGPEKYSIENGVYYSFDEKEIITSALSKRNGNIT